MLRHRLFWGVALVAASAGGAWAQNRTIEFGVTGSVTGSAPQVCTLAAPALTSGSLINVRNLDGTSLQIEQLVNPTTLATTAASAEVVFAANCTVPHRVVLESQSNGLWRNQTSGGGRPSGFADAVPYAAVLTWGDITNRFEANATARGARQTISQVGEATVGELKIAFSIQPGASNVGTNSPLLAGVYSDTLILTLEPQ